MTTYRTIFLLLSLVVFVQAALGQSNRQRNSIPLTKALGQAADTVGYAKALGPRTFIFPDDYGAHPTFKTEWWYYTGNLTNDDGQRFGFQFTIFRQALSPNGTDSSASRWRTNQLYMGHFAVSNPQEDNFYAFERFSRGGAGLAGAEADPFRAWIQDWEVSQIGDDPTNMRLIAEQDDVELDLTLTPQKPLVLQGENGYDKKGAGPGDASYYFSFTRLESEGVLVIDGEEHMVSGSSWMDREWSTSALGDNQVGWDWFSLQLSNNVDLMFYLLRKSDGNPDIFSHGVIIDPDGDASKFDASEMVLTILDWWESPYSGARYPSGWNLKVASRDVDLDVIPIMKDQEMNVSVRYWEGAVDVSGEIGNARVYGKGFVELTGYGDEDVVDEAARIP